MPSLGNDLATVRKKKDLSIEDVQQNTRIPAHILRSIEDDSIFDNMPNNVTYTRSYVRSYARAIGIREADIVRALDRVEKGNYGGELAPGTDPDSNKEPEQPEEEPKNDLSQEAPPKQPDESPPSQETVQKPVSYKASKRASDDWDWVQVGQQAKTKNARSSRTGLLIIFILIAAIAAGFLIYNYYYAENDSPEAEVHSSNELQQPTTPSDSLQEVLLNDENNPGMSSGRQAEGATVLGDTLTVGVYAAAGRLEPVRVYTDILEQQNPYWVQQGDTIRFNFVNTIRLRAVDQYDRLQLLFNGHIIQNYYQEYYNSESGMIELDRTVFKNHPEWQRPVE